MESLTLIQIRDFVIVLVAILAFIVLIGNVIKTIKDWKKPTETEAEWRQSVDRKLDTDNKRLVHLESGNKVKCKALRAIMSHEINGNSIEKLEQAMSDLDEYLLEGAS